MSEAHHVRVTQYTQMITDRGDSLQWLPLPGHGTAGGSPAKPA
jgi:hypothetical protein